MGEEDMEGDTVEGEATEVEVMVAGAMVRI